MFKVYDVIIWYLHILGTGFSGSHEWMWELDHRESWVAKNWSFWTVVLEKTHESILDCKEIQPVHPKGNQFWMFIGRTDVEANTLATWCKELTHQKRPWCWERLKAGGEGDNRGWYGWMASPTQRTWVWASSGSWWWTGNLACCSPWGHRESDMTERLNWSDHQKFITSISSLQLLLVMRTFEICLLDNFQIYKAELIAIVTMLHITLPRTYLLLELCIFGPPSKHTSLCIYICVCIYMYIYTYMYIFIHIPLCIYFFICIFPSSGSFPCLGYSE